MKRRRGADLAAISVLLIREFRRGHNLRVHARGVVHRVVLEESVGGVKLPGPACRVGTSGFRPDQLAAVRDPVTCSRPACARPPKTVDPVLGEPCEVQLALIS